MTEATHLVIVALMLYSIRYSDIKSNIYYSTVWYHVH